MLYRGQLCELYFQILDHKQCRRPSPKFPIRFMPLTTHASAVDHPTQAKWNLCLYGSVQRVYPNRQWPGLFNTQFYRSRS